MEKLNDTSLFRKIYIIDLFFCMLSFVQVAAYVFLVPLFIWGLRLVYLNQRRYNTFFKMRFGLWIGAFLIASLLSTLINFSYTILFSLLMFLHVLICFFIFYGMHTETGFNFKEELYFIAKFFTIVTTILNVIGIFSLMFGSNISGVSVPSDVVVCICKSILLGKNTHHPSFINTYKNSILFSHRHGTKFLIQYF
jgi:hypothetical protein